jgi:amino acid transporter
MNAQRPDDTTRSAGRSDSEKELQRQIGPGTLAASVINATIGTGIFTLPVVVALRLGHATVVAYLICAVLVGLIFLCYAEAGSRVSVSGGAYAYVETAFGPYAGFLTSSLLWFGYSMLSDAAIADALVSMLATMVPWAGKPVPRALIMIAMFGGLAAFNIRGVRSGARLVVGLTLAKLAPLVLLIVLGFSHVRWGDIDPTGAAHWDDLGATTLLLFFMFAGGETAVTPSGEIRNPNRTVPRGLLMGIGAVVFIYMIIQAVTQSVLGADMEQYNAAPLVGVADRLIGPAGATLLLVGACVSIFGTLSGDMLNTPRAIYAASRDGLLPGPFAAIHPRFRTPHLAIALLAVLACTFAIAGAFRSLAVASSACLLLVDLAVALSVLVLRRRNVRAGDYVFKVRGGPLIPILGALVVLWTLSHIARDEAIGVALLVVASSILYLYSRYRRQKALDAAA